VDYCRQQFPLQETENCRCAVNRNSLSNNTAVCVANRPVSSHCSHRTLAHARQNKIYENNWKRSPSTPFTVYHSAKRKCRFVVQQVVRLVVRLADCCMQLAVDLSWTCCETSCPTCCKTCCLSYNLLWTSVVDLLLAFDLSWIWRTACCNSTLHNKSTTNRSNGVRHTDLQRSLLFSQGSCVPQ